MGSLSEMRPIISEHFRTCVPHGMLFDLHGDVDGRPNSIPFHVHFHMALVGVGRVPMADSSGKAAAGPSQELVAGLLTTMNSVFGYSKARGDQVEVMTTALASECHVPCNLFQLLCSTLYTLHTHPLTSSVRRGSVSSIIFQWFRW
jgi:hypothetical protein